jgi:hypothetical protein
MDGGKPSERRVPAKLPPGSTREMVQLINPPKTHLGQDISQKPPNAVCKLYSSTSNGSCSRRARSSLAVSRCGARTGSLSRSSRARSSVSELAWE